MTLLNSIITDPAPAAPKGIIYSPAGTGKTTFGASADGSIIVDCENGAGAIKCTRTPYLDNWPDIHNWLKEIERSDHPYRAMVVDSIDWLLRRIEEHVSGCSNGKAESTLNRSHGGFGNGKQVFKNYVYQILLPLFDRIVSRGIAVILLAHAKRDEITDIDGITIEKTTPELPEGYLNVMVEWSDFVCLAKKIDEDTRILITSETPRALAKNRYSMPPEIEFSWDSFTSAIAEGLEKNFSNNINTTTGEITDGKS
ncbi:MAG: ATP-binding protein [Sedimentisphaeraceae bacterium JB056]